MADHVIHDALAPLKGDDDRVVLVAALQFIGANQYLNLLLVDDVDGVGAVLQPPDGGRVFLLVNEAWWSGWKGKGIKGWALPYAL